MGGWRTCCIKGCTEKSRKNRKINLPVKFYSFPSTIYNELYKLDKREKWINAVINHVKNPKDWEPVEHSRVCSSHFVNNSKSEHPHSPSYVPTIFPGDTRWSNPTLNLKKSSPGGLKNYKDKIDIKTKQESRDNEAAHPSIFAGDTKLSCQSKSSFHNYSLVGINDYQDNVVPKMEQNSGDEEEIQVQAGTKIKVSNKCRPAHRSICCQTDALTEHLTDDVTYFFCNLNNQEGVSTAEVQVNISVKKKVVNMCKGRVKKEVRDSGCDPINFVTIKPNSGDFHGLFNITTNEAMNSLTGVSFDIFSYILRLLPDTKIFKVNKKTKLLITLMKLKTGLTLTALSVLFNIHRSTVNRIFVQILQQLNTVLNSVFWPTKAEVHEAMSNAFKDHCPETRVIIDCSEVNTEVSPEIKNIAQLKYPPAIKFLVGCTPSGFISYISKCYSCQRENWFIANDCGIINLLDPGDALIADESFSQIQSNILEKNASFVMTPFSREKFRSEEVDKTFNIASIKKPIDRVNQRLKEFHILCKLPVTLLPHCDEIVFVICALLNLKKPLFMSQTIK